MTMKDAKSFGKTHAYRSAFYVFFILEILLFFSETHGDFGNGLLFFITDQLNIFFAILLLLYFGSTWFFGQMAGINILINNRNPLLIALVYSILTTIILAIYLLIIVAYLKYRRYPSPRLLISREDIKQVSIHSFILFIFLFAGWLLAIYRMKLEKGIKKIQKKI